MTHLLLGSEQSGSLPPMDLLLTTKLRVPPVRANLVARPKLIVRLDQALAIDPSVLLLTAPPGYGKTTLLSAWLQPLLPDSESTAGSRLKVAWLSLDEADNDARRFLTYCVAALRAIDPEIYGGVGGVADQPDPA